MRTAAVTRAKPFQVPPVRHDANSSEPAFHGYRLSASFVEKGPFRDGAPLRVGAIVGGLSELKAGQARRLFQWPGLGRSFYPLNADALAVNAQGALGVLRTPSAGEPATTADPAWLLHPDGSISAVAPWSRLFTADAPECKPTASDYRAVFQTSRAWLRLVDSGQPVPEEALEAGMFAVLRLNPDRLCLEAVELASAPTEREDGSYETRLSARFTGPHATAAKLGFAPGFELRQPLSCSLNGSH
jgi:hypothetical protein